MINSRQQWLFDVLDEFLDECDRHFDGGEAVDWKKHYRRINRALDGIYRDECGMDQPIKTGRPLGCTDKVPRKRRDPMP